MKRYDLTEDGYRRKFRASKPDVDESPEQFIVRLERYLLRWLELSNTALTFDGLKDLIVKAPETLAKIAKIADQYLEAHGSVVMGVRYKKLHRLFTTAKNTNKRRTINTHIISVSIFPPAKAELVKNVTLVFKNLKSAGNDRECVFWNLSESKWSGDGCYVNFTPGSSETTCVCNHLTHFAVLMDLTNVDAKLSQTDRNLLEILTYVGLGLSILGSVITIISHWLLTEMISPLFQIRVSLMSSLLTGQITFLVGINATANKVRKNRMNEKNG
ncbi:adhesion G protein-coupled receptor L4-like [Montipora foliosa]|uniref:adhesion G protein-coupled receptor L4-like n=1 Tax=Montipora foliosa TaxID=591990 RepID=UPI0035F12B1A